MTEWEQIKKEYREIPIPTDGPHQMLEVMASAKRKRDQWKRVVKCGSGVAAALLVVILLPGIVFFNSGFGESKDMAAPETLFDSAESTGSSDGWFFATEAGTAEENKAEAPQSTASSEVDCDGAMNNVGSSAPVLENSAEDFSLCIENISAEILRQMETRMQENGETYYIKSELYPEGFEKISEEQNYYVNEDELYVIVFEAGTVAPEAMGVIEFIIPAEVAVP